MAVTGSHVGPRHCHTSGRVIDIHVRAWVAAQRHMGFEMDPRELTDDEAVVLKDVTAWWKTNRNWTIAADILRLDSVDPEVTAELQRAADGSRFIVFVGQTGTSAQVLPRPLRLSGLEVDAMYKVALLDSVGNNPASRKGVTLSTAPVVLSGRFLMQQGLSLPKCFPQSIWVVEGERV
jgi:alpha-galactosidase